MNVTIFTLEEAAEVLRINASTLVNYRRRGEIKGFRQGNKWYFTPEDIEEYITRRKGKSLCAANQHSPSLKTEPEALNPPIGISNTMTEREASASQRGIALAKKTMKRISPLHRSS